MVCGNGVARGFPIPAYSGIPLQPKACVSEICGYNSRLSFAVLEAGEIEFHSIHLFYIPWIFTDIELVIVLI